jgi:hypothetical protein
MSWHITGTGTQDDAKRQLRTADHVPADVCEAVDAALALFDAGKSVEITTHGHLDHLTDTGTLTITARTIEE